MPEITTGELTELVNAVNFARDEDLHLVRLYQDGSGGVGRNPATANGWIWFSFHSTERNHVYERACEWFFAGMDYIERYVREDEPFIERRWTIREIEPGMFTIYAIGSFKTVTFEYQGKDTDLVPESKVHWYIRQMLDVYRDPSRVRRNISPLRFDWIYLP